MFDKDGGGTISHDEIREVFNQSGANNLDPTTVEEIIKEIDANGDGEIDFDEFKQMMKATEKRIEKDQKQGLCKRTKNWM